MPQKKLLIEVTIITEKLNKWKLSATKVTQIFFYQKQDLRFLSNLKKNQKFVGSVPAFVCRNS